MCDKLSLSALPLGESGQVVEIQNPPPMARRLTDLGLIPGTRVTCLLNSPAGDPRAYLIRGAVIALRQADAQPVSVTGGET